MVVGTSGDMSNPKPAHGCLEIFSSVAWSIVRYKYIWNTQFTEDGLEMFCDNLSCHACKLTNKRNVTHVIKYKELVLAVKCEDVSGLVGPWLSWNFLT